MAKALTLSERKRLAIVEAAQLEFKAKGYLGASMDSIAQGANVSKRTVYNHFPSKEALFHAIVLELCDSFAQVANVEYQSDVPLAEQLMVMAKNELALLCNEQFFDLNRIILAEFIRSPELAASTIARFGEQESSFSIWLNAAIADNRLQAVDADYAKQQFMGIIKSVSFWPQLLLNTAIPTKEQQQQIAEDAVFMFLALYQIKTD